MKVVKIINVNIVANCLVKMEAYGHISGCFIMVNPNALLLHIKQVHKGQKQFKCNICTAGALLLSNLQLVPGRDNIRDVGLQTFKQVLLNKQQINIIKFTNFRPKMAAFSLKTFRLYQNEYLVAKSEVGYTRLEPGLN